MKNLIRYTFFFVWVSLLMWSCSPGWEIDNPYRNVDWKNHKQYEANLHTHTTRSDGRLSPQDVVDRYHNYGYKILAITDHNEVTFPWTSFSKLSFSETSARRLKEGEIEESSLVYEDRNPEELGMLAIQGNEVSAPHHMGSYFTNYQTRTEDENIAIKAIGEMNGLILLNHPGRYTGKNPEKYNTGWYVNLFNQYSHVTGMEVYNQGDRYPHDRKLWDFVLVETMPVRPVWGYSNDDFHVGDNKLGRNWNVFILPELNEKELRAGMFEGKFFYVKADEGHTGPKTAKIQSIDVNDAKGIITVNCTGQDSIHWISAGNVVAKGNEVYLADIPESSNYVRGEIYSPGAVTGTQPFGITKK